MTDESLDALSARIERCMPQDRQRLGRRMRELARGRNSSEVATSLVSDDVLRSVSAEIDAAEARLARRSSGELLDPSAIRFDPALPIAARADEIAEAVRARQVVVVCGETGSGKTTQLPKICLRAGRGIAGMIGHTQPRRIAARSVATRIAQELGVKLGEAVGYSVRFADRTNPETLVRIMTDGILLAELGGPDRLLLKYDTIIIDEAHERSLNIDFLLGYLRTMLPRRPDLKLIITSATIDPQRFSRHFNDAPIIEVSGRGFPVELRYAPLPPDAEADEDDPAMLAAIASALEETGRDAAHAGDALVFLSGEREIHETAKFLRERLPPGHEILPLYARLSSDEQNRVFQPHTGRRIVLATNVAETSLTVPGIRSVVDPGLARVSRYSATSRVQRLPIERVSQASARQRAGRCGRIAPGTCIRLYSEEDFEARPAFTDPEILRSNLASVILQMKSLRLGAIEEFPFLNRPRPSSVREGLQTLHELGALDARDELTELGRRLARWPIDPRFGRMILQAQREQALREVLVIVSALAAQDPRLRPLEKSSLADAAHAEFVHEQSDFLSLVKIWEWWQAQSKEYSSSKLRRLCESRFISYVRMREWMDTHRQLHALAMAAGMRSNTDPARYEQVHRSLLAGLLGNVGMKANVFEYQGVSDRRFAMFPGSALFRNQPRWVMAAEMVETTRLYARMVARIHPEWIEALAPHMVKRAYTAPHWNRQSAHVEAFERVTLRGLTVIPRRRVHYGRIDLPLARETFIQHALVEGDYQPPHRRGHPAGAVDDSLQANRSLIAELRDAEHKARRRDVLVGPQTLFALYDARIPPHVCNGPSFEKWRRQAERRNPHALRLQRGDVMRGGAALVTPEDFPATIDISGAALPLEYRHEPGHADDGVTLNVPMETLRQLREERCDWLVPGMLREKVAALIKSLPKQLRTSFVPVPHHVEAVVGNITFGVGVLTDAIARELDRSTGVRVPRDAWRPETLPDHLRMNFRVLNAAGETMASGRDLHILRARIGGAASEILTLPVNERLQRGGITHWDFDDLPERVILTRGAIDVVVYPAIIDEGNSVGVRVFDTQEAARQAHHAGLRRLFVMQVREELRMHVEYLPGIDQMALHYAPLARSRKGASLINDLVDLIADRAFLRDDADVRAGEEFRRRLDAGWDQLWSIASGVADLVARILAARHDLQLRIDGAADNDFLEPSIDDIRRQLRELMPADFLVTTPWRWLAELPRLLNAIVIRMQKLINAGLARDLQAMEVVEEFRRRFEQRRSSAERTGMPLSPGETEFRWLIEELRVSLFAQELRTSVPISPARLERAWAALA